MYYSRSGETLTTLFDRVTKAGASTSYIKASPGHPSVHEVPSGSLTSFFGMVTVASPLTSNMAGKAGGAVQVLREHLKAVLMVTVARFSVSVVGISHIPGMSLALLPVIALLDSFIRYIFPVRVVAMAVAELPVPNQAVPL